MSGLEAIAAFGLACNVMQVISLVHDGVQVAKTIYDTGCLDPVLAGTTDGLTRGLEALTKSLESISAPLSPDDHELLEISRDVLDTASALKGELNKVAGVSSKSKPSAALRGWFRTITGGKKKIERLENAVRSQRELLENRLLLRVCTKTDAILVQQQSDFNHLSTVLQGFVQACARGQTSLDQLIQLEAASVKAHTSSETTHLHRSLNSSIVTESERVRGYFSSHVEDLMRQEFQDKAYVRLLGSLQYETMNQRRNQIKTSHQETFQWIFHAEQDDGQSTSSSQPDIAWDDFVKWLQSDTKQPYWVSGKAGSGKSTLVKFLINHPQTKAILDASKPGTIVLSHFFWALGQQLERSISGIFCSLLWQLLVEDAECSKRILDRFPTSRHKRAPSDWSIDEIADVTLDTLSTHPRRFCLFLDGLDEIDPREDQAALFGLIDKLCAISQFRLCLSSRPEPALQKRFGNGPSLRLHDLTRNDIYRYAKDALAELLIGERFFFERLTDIVRVKADGVFLWAALVLRSIQSGLSNGDDRAELIQRLESLPGDLSSLYQDMWRRLNDNEPIYRKEAAQYFNLMLDCVKGSPLFQDVSPGLLTLALDPLLASNVLGKGAYDLHHFVGACQRTSRRLQVRCAGILEVNKVGHVTFIHRSAEEFLTGTPEGQRIREADTSSMENRVLNLFRGHLGCIKLFLCSRTRSCVPSCIATESIADSYRTIKTVRDLLGSEWRLSAETLAEIFRISRALYEEGQWTFHPHYVIRPDFLGLLAFAGCLDQASTAFERLVAEAPEGMRVSSRYRKYLAEAACSHFALKRRFRQGRPGFVRLLFDRPVVLRRSSRHISMRLRMAAPYYYIPSEPFTDIITSFLEVEWGPASVRSDSNVPRVLLELLNAGCDLDSPTIVILRRLGAQRNRFSINQRWVRGTSQPDPRAGETLVLQATRLLFLQIYLRMAPTHLQMLQPSFPSSISSAVNDPDAHMVASLAAVIPDGSPFPNKVDETEVLISCTGDDKDFKLRYIETDFGVEMELTSPDASTRLQQISDGACRATLAELENSLIQDGHLVSHEEVLRKWPPKPYAPEDKDE